MDDLKAELDALKKEVTELRRKVNRLEAERDIPPQSAIDIRRKAETLHKRNVESLLRKRAKKKSKQKAP